MKKPQPGMNEVNGMGDATLRFSLFICKYHVNTKRGFRISRGDNGNVLVGFT